MSNYKTTLLGTILAITMSPAAFAESTTAAAPVDCAADFMAMDVDRNGYLSDAEAPRAYAQSRVDNMTTPTSGLSKDDYDALCNAPNWAANTPEEGAPFEGANSFTEGQAHDRAVAWNVTDVSALTKDDKGVWRGTGKVAGSTVSVAIDFKGNVVTTSAQP